MHSTEENKKEFITYAVVFVACTLALELLYIGIFIVRYRKTNKISRPRARRDEAYETSLVLDLTTGTDHLCHPQMSGPGSIYPSYWNPFESTDGGFKLVNIQNNSEEFVIVSSTFEKTMDRTRFGIEKVERIQNQVLWSRYYDCTRRMHENNNGVTNELNLFHGTRTKDPKDIFQGDAGFDMRFGDPNGYWGKGNYFAVDASYSNGYHHRTTNGSRQMLMAHVLTGYEHNCPPDKSLIRPPVRERAPIEKRYDSVSGTTGGSKVYITYDNDRAYPAYLITYKCL